VRGAAGDERIKIELVQGKGNLGMDRLCASGWLVNDRCGDQSDNDFYCWKEMIDILFLL
jgi:hypothetical protein